MQIIEWQQFLDNDLLLGGKYASMTIGIFDGVHRGHQALIERIVSHNVSFAPVIVTFRQNHKTFDGEHLTNIHTFEQRLKIFESLGIQKTIIIDFSETFRKMPGIAFLEILLKHANIGFFAVGSNFKCGYKLDTNAEIIKKFFASRDIPAEIVPQVMEGSLPISSSRIRAIINSGDITQAEAMMGAYSMRVNIESNSAPRIG